MGGRGLGAADRVHYLCCNLAFYRKGAHRRADAGIAQICHGGRYPGGPHHIHGHPQHGQPRTCTDSPLNRDFTDHRGIRD